jgi:hypothetical protein
MFYVVLVFLNNYYGFIFPFIHQYKNNKFFPHLKPQPYVHVTPGWQHPSKRNTTVFWDATPCNFI